MPTQTKYTVQQIPPIDSSVAVAAMRNANTFAMAERKWPNSQIASIVAPAARLYDLHQRGGRAATKPLTRFDRSDAGVHAVRLQEECGGTPQPRNIAFMGALEPGWFACQG
jgi:hypothetical protein